MKKDDTYKDKGLRVAVQHKNETAGKMTLSDDFTDRLMQRIEKQNEKPIRRRIKFWPWIAAACVAASLVVFLIPPKGTEEEKKIVTKVERKMEEKNIKSAIIAKKEPETKPATPIKRKKREKRNSITPTVVPQQQVELEIQQPAPVEVKKEVVKEVATVILTERDLPVTRPENYKYTPEEIALMKRQAAEAYLKWVELELEIAKYNQDQTANNYTDL
jgi:hypothetical protein